MFWKNFIKSILIILFFDLLWIGIVNKQNYVDVIVKVQKTEFITKYASAVIVYIAMALMIVIWIIPKVLEVTTNKSDLMLNSYKYGCLLGLLTYLVFNFTNSAIFTEWSLKISLMDTLWGTFLMGTATYLTIL